MGTLTMKLHTTPVTDRLRTALAATVAVLSTFATTLPASARGSDDDDATLETAAGGSSTSGQIVFRRYFDADQTRGALFVMDPDGSHVRRVTFPHDGWKDNVPSWSRDGTRIVFERFRSDESTSKIMVVNPDRGRARVVVPCGSGCVYAIDPYFSPDGRSVAYARTVAPPHVRHPPEWRLYSAIFLVGLDGRGARQVTRTPKRHRGQPPSFDATDPTFSPDGRTLAFLRVHYRPEERTAVFVQPLGSPGAARRLTPWRLNCQDRPTFSPDGKRLLFRCMPRGEEGPSNLYWVRRSGEDLQQITHASPDRQYLGSSFSPSFRNRRGWITAGRTGGSGEDGNADVFAIRIRDGKVSRRVNLTKSEQWDSSPGWGVHPRVG